MAKSPSNAIKLSSILASKRHEVEQTLQRFVSAHDQEALHDLRVALRRMLSLLRTGNHAATAQLSHMLKSTNRARDLEIFPLCLQQLSLSLPELEYAWQNQLTDEIGRLQRTLPALWESVAKTAVLPSHSDHSQKQRIAQHLDDEIKRLRKRRRRLCRHWDPRTAHKLRISGKRIRYLLEPFITSHSPAKSSIDAMKAFQELLGEYHDYTVLLANPEFSQTPAIVVVEEKLRRLREAFIVTQCGTPKLDNALDSARKAFAAVVRRKIGDVV